MNDSDSRAGRSRGQRVNDDSLWASTFRMAGRERARTLGNRKAILEQIEILEEYRRELDSAIDRIQSSKLSEPSIIGWICEGLRVGANATMEEASEESAEQGLGNALDLGDSESTSHGVGNAVHHTDSEGAAYTAVELGIQDVHTKTEAVDAEDEICGIRRKGRQEGQTSHSYATMDSECAQRGGPDEGKSIQRRTGNSRLARLLGNTRHEPNSTSEDR